MQRTDFARFPWPLNLAAEPLTPWSTTAMARLSYPALDDPEIKPLVERICFTNAKEYFGL